MTVPVTLLSAESLAVVVARAGSLPLGAAEAVAEAGGAALVVGSGAKQAAEALAPNADRVWWADTGAGLRVGALAAALGGLLDGVPLIVLPGSPDGRDLAPRLAAVLDRPLFAQAIRVCYEVANVRAELSRVDDRVLVAVEHDGPAVATLVPGVRSVVVYGSTDVVEVALPDPLSEGMPGSDVEVLDVLEPDPATMDLAEAPRVLGGGAGLVPAGTGDAGARAIFALLTSVAARLGASTGATRVVTDAGWLGYDRQIGTTGVAIDPELYVALGVAGASQHTGGLGAPRHVVSVNTDASSPMTAMADLGLVTDALSLLIELARRLDVPVPGEVPRV
jgi:electron transfer flavoprotein alpha subunit